MEEIPKKEGTADLRKAILRRHIRERTSTRVTASMTQPLDVSLQDPLREVTRRERRSLLGLSVVSIVVVKTGLLPTQISTLGIVFTPADNKAMMWVLAGVMLYFLVAFLIYAASDFLSWRWALVKALQDLANRRRQEQEELDRTSDEQYAAVSTELAIERRLGGYLFGAVGVTTFVRAVFEFLLPIVLGTVVLRELWKAAVVG